MAEIVNLNKARKTRTRAARKKTAKERRAPQTAARSDRDTPRRERELDGKLLDERTDDA